MTKTKQELIREADQILAKAGLNKVGLPQSYHKPEEAMKMAVRTPCGGQPGYKRK